MFILCVYFVSMYVCVPCVSWVYGGQPPSGSWELNSGPLQEQQIFLIAEPSLQLLKYFWNKQKAPLELHCHTPGTFI